MDEQLTKLIATTEEKVRLEQSNAKRQRDIIKLEEEKKERAQKRLDEQIRHSQLIREALDVLGRNERRLAEIKSTVEKAISQNVVLAEIDLVSRNVATIAEAIRIMSAMIPQLATSNRSDTRPLLAKSKEVEAIVDSMEEGAKVSKAMSQAFNMEELALLMANLGETLEEYKGETLPAKVNEIVSAYQRRGSIQTLKAAISRERPHLKI